MTHFYLTLPSNSSMSYYPGNTIANFKTRLSIPIDLEGEWEVGLAEIIYPKAWLSVPKDQSLTIRSIVSVNDLRGTQYVFEEQSYRVAQRSVTVNIEKGAYRSVFELLIKINQCIIRDTFPIFTDAKRIRFKVDPRNGKTKLVLAGKFIVTITPNLLEILGFDRNRTPFISPQPMEKTYESDYVGDACVEKQVMFVYCDLVQCVPVGDTQSPLLRIVNMDNERIPIHQKYFEKPRYIPLQTKSFDSIEIDIRNDFGENMPFDSGKLIVTLHFRKSRGSYFSS